MIRLRAYTFQVSRLGMVHTQIMPITDEPGGRVMRTASIGLVVAMLAVGVTHDASAAPAASSTALKPAIDSVSFAHEAYYWRRYGYYGYPRYYGYRYPRYYGYYGYAPRYYYPRRYYGAPYYYGGYYRPYRRYYY